MASISKPPIFQYEFKNEDGSTDVWKYNLNINRYGPIEVVNVPPPRQPKQTKKKSKYIKDDQDTDA